MVMNVQHDYYELCISRKWLSIVNLKGDSEQKNEYISALEEAEKGNNDRFTDSIAARNNETLRTRNSLLEANEKNISDAEKETNKNALNSALKNKFDINI